MHAVRIALWRLCVDQQGATAIEYGLIVSLIVIAMAGALGSLGGGVGCMWGSMANNVTNHL